MTSSALEITALQARIAHSSEAGQGFQLKLSRKNCTLIPLSRIDRSLLSRTPFLCRVNSFLTLQRGPTPPYRKACVEPHHLRQRQRIKVTSTKSIASGDSGRSNHLLIVQPPCYIISDNRSVNIGQDINEPKISLTREVRYLVDQLLESGIVSVPCSDCVKPVSFSLAQFRPIRSA